MLYQALRWAVTAVYIAATVFGIIADPVGEERYPIPPTILALTASYAILMGLVWLYERHPPGRG